MEFIVRTDEPKLLKQLFLEDFYVHSIEYIK